MDAWIQSLGYSSSKSSAGRIALAMLQALGGLSGARTIAHKSLIQRLDAMSHGVAESATSEDGQRRHGKTQTRPRCESHEKVMALLKQLHENRTDICKRHLQNLRLEGSSSSLFTARNIVNEISMMCQAWCEAAAAPWSDSCLRLLLDESHLNEISINIVFERPIGTSGPALRISLGTFDLTHPDAVMRLRRLAERHPA
ncbi:MAG: hypothetical protein EOO38_32430 [Cytophagaceae bacterium]|nr:MAG: hypothetical protein EOO38_32430 [Cytophagaceae bacterium]